MGSNRKSHYEGLECIVIQDSVIVNDNLGQF
jgi:hypothetical protein